VKEFFKNLSYPYKLSLFIGFIFILGMFLGSFGYKTYFLNKKQSSNTLAKTYASPLPTILEEKRETSKDANRFNILLLGFGGAGHPGGTLADSIIVVSINTTDKKATLISIPRDLYFSGHKINNDPSIKDALNAITGLAISNTISVDFNSFIKFIDSLGGISVDVKKAYTDNFYPVKGLENELCGFDSQKVSELHQKYSGFELEKQFTCRYETISYAVGLNQMDGSNALKYVRSRHGGSDFVRSQHQFEVLKAILQKADVNKVAEVFSFVKTDLNENRVKEILASIGNPLDYSVSSIQLTEENVLVSSKSKEGAYILVPRNGEGKFEEIKKYIKNNI